MNYLYKDIWNENHKDFIGNRSEIRRDNWLDEFNDIISSVKTNIIDLGCGSGNNVLSLLEKGKEVIACDYSDYAIQKLQENIPEVKTIQFDMTDGLPFDDNFSELIIADLSLHYFSVEETMKVIKEIQRVLKPDGHLLFRVNSTKDFTYREENVEEIEEHFYYTMNMQKRFFDRADIEYFFEDWKLEEIVEEELFRLKNKKIVWKCCAKNIK